MEEMNEITERIRDFEIWRSTEFASDLERLGDFYDGFQWGHTNNPPQHAVTANDTLANVDIKCRALAFDDPEPIVSALDGPNEEGERIWQGVLKATFRYCHANKEMKKVIRWTNVLGFAGTYAWFDERSGWPKLKALDPRTIAFDPEMEDWDNPEWIAVCSYVPQWQLIAQFGSKAEGLAPDLVRRRQDAMNTSARPYTTKGYVKRIKVWEYWQKEGRIHAIWASQRPDKPLLYHEISDTEGKGRDPGFPEGLVIPIRLLIGVPAINSLIPHSYVKLGYETQVRLNEAMTSLVQAYKRLVPSMITRKGTFDATEKRKMMQGEIGEVYEVTEDVMALGDAIQNMPNPTLNAAVYPHLERLERQLHMYHNVTEYHQGVQVSSRTTATEAQGRMRFSGIRGKGEEQDLREHIAECFHMLRDLWLYYAPGTVVRYENEARQPTYQTMDSLSLAGIQGPKLDFPAYIAVRESSTLRKDSVLEQQAQLQLFSTLLPLAQALPTFGYELNIVNLLEDLLRSFDRRDIGRYIRQSQGAPLDINANTGYTDAGFGNVPANMSDAGRLPELVEEMGT